MSIISGKDTDVIIFFASSLVYATIGILGNLLIILVYVSKRHSLSQQKNILALAIVDFTICIFVMPYRIIYELKAIENDIICRGMEIISHMTVIFSNLVLCLICVERFVKVWKPTKIISERLTLFWILIALGFSVVISIPVCTMFMVISGSAADSPKFCQFSSKTVGKLGTTVYTYILLLMNVSVLGALVILYSLIYCRLYKNTRTLTDHNKSDVAGTSILKVGPLQTEAESGPSQSHREHSQHLTTNSEYIDSNKETAIEDLKSQANEGGTDCTGKKPWKETS
ncbi:neuropeptide Y receptor type 6-like [Ostrea edulis]|uniref:neuropeptide Y receptor type 6-like n=1 Tax=Ostrea edulis TaxID=37623 RepID=UPI0024AF5793|nr:neuropeptide Y receptor type 6-like [Ostrea edulis]